MRKLCVCVALASVLSAAGHAAQDDPPRFRGKVDLITVDVAAVDGKGKPIEDLKPGDFTVKVDGKVRPVVSAELIKVDKGAAAAPPAKDPRVSANNAPANVRRLIMAVDQTLIPPGAVAPLLYTGAKFIDRLRPEDYAAFVAFPEPGARVDFTTEKEPVKKALQSIIGSAQGITTGDFDLSVTEAFDIALGAEAIRNTAGIATAAGGSAAALEANMGPAMRRVLERGCRTLTWEELRANAEAMEQCRRDLSQEAMRVSSQGRIDTDVSMRALEQILQGLVPLEGPKTMILFSAGLVSDNLSLFEPLARLAASARTTINVIYADFLPDRQAQMPYRASTLGFIDRSMERTGLEVVADRTGGTLYRGLSAGNGIFERIESEMSGWYLVAVERQPGDPERQRVEVAVKRRGVSVRSNRTFVSAPPSTYQVTEARLNDALSSPFSIPGIPLRVSTFTQRDAEPGKYRVSVAAEIGQPGQPGGEFALGYVLADERGRPKKTGGAKRVLSPRADAANQPLLFDTSLTAEPGTYLLRFGVVDGEGRRGTVIHHLELPPIDGDAVAASDLIVGSLAGEGEPIHPTVDPHVTSGALAAYLELYVKDQDRDRVTVNLEIAEGDASPALASQPLTIRAGDKPSSRLATGAIETTMVPGRYVARATIQRDGKVIQTVSRSFTLVVNSAAAAPVVPRERGGVPIPATIQQRTASYVASFVGGLGNVVTQEDFVLSKPDRRVTSDLLLVRYPGTQRDLISYRDVALLNNAPLPGRDERLLDLFVNSAAERVRDRARKIMLAADSYVPSMFNPMFVIGFLQSDFQSRFELTMTDAGPEWPAGVKAVGFVETARPTLLRTGPFGDVDVPSRGTAWIEESTGRILQTELHLGIGRQPPSMVTKFKLDDRLQIIVPESMRTQNPEGAAIYTNFRRFNVASDATIPAPAAPPPAAPPQR